MRLNWVTRSGVSGCWVIGFGCGVVWRGMIRCGSGCGMIWCGFWVCGFALIGYVRNITTIAIYGIIDCLQSTIG